MVVVRSISGLLQGLNEKTNEVFNTSELCINDSFINSMDRNYKDFIDALFPLFS